jgi:hypothetical protein
VLAHAIKLPARPPAVDPARRRSPGRAAEAVGG